MARQRLHPDDAARVRAYRARRKMVARVDAADADELDRLLIYLHAAAHSAKENGWRLGPQLAKEHPAHTLEAIAKWLSFQGPQPFRSCGRPDLHAQALRAIAERKPEDLPRGTYPSDAHYQSALEDVRALARREKAAAKLAAKSATDESDET